MKAKKPNQTKPNNKTHMHWNEQKPILHKTQEWQMPLSMFQKTLQK